MKRYFEKKAFGWYFIFTVLYSLIAILTMSVISATLLHDETLRRTVSGISAYVYIPVFSLVFLLSGNVLVNKIQKDGEYAGEYGKYRYFFYPLACAVPVFITSLNSLFQKGFGTAKEIISKNTFASGMVKAGLVTALELAMLVLSLVIVSKVIGSLLCAVTEGEESEKRFFSKIGLPICISFAGVIIVDLVLLIFFDFSAILFISDILYLALFALMLLGLKYKFDDVKLRKIICNVLPFAYVGLQAVIAAVKIVSLI